LQRYRPLLTSPYPEMVSGQFCASLCGDTKRLPFGCQRKNRARRIFPIERIHSRACTGICEQHECRNEDNQHVVAQNEMSLAFPVFSVLYWLGFGVFKLAGVAAIRFRTDSPESNWLNLENHGFGVSRRSVQNKMFCAHVISHECGLTTVSHKAVGRQRQRNIKNCCVCWHLSRHTARFAVTTRTTTISQKLKSAAMTKLLRGWAL
jgi:hypothetical protein